MTDLADRYCSLLSRRKEVNEQRRSNRLSEPDMRKEEKNEAKSLDPP